MRGAQDSSEYTAARRLMALALPGFTYGLDIVLLVGWLHLGKHQTPLEIKSAVEKLISVCKELVEWESEVRFIIAPSPAQTIKHLMEGWTSQFLAEINSTLTS